MRVHHLSCGTMCPPVERAIHGTGGLLSPGRMVCHCLLVETPSSGLVLVDTGLGLADVREPRRRLGAWFSAVTRPLLLEEETAVRRVAALGFSPGDVRHIVVTHLDLDHAGGLSDFPAARVHVWGAELEAARARLTIQEKNRYRPAQWAHRPDWEPISHTSGEPWMGFEAARDLEGLPPEILIVPLAGHTRGHAAVAVRGERGWLLHAGDAYFSHHEMDPAGRRCPFGLDLFQRLVQVNGELRMANQERLRRLVRDRSDEVTVFCAHDVVEHERLASA